MDIQAAIRANLGRLNWTLGDLAKKSGIPYGTLIKKTQGKTDFRVSEIERIAAAFGITELRFFEAAEEAEALKGDYKDLK
ncbi:MAG: helix-turn-helix transcriptional regulator [Actinomycetaceae bacterium]|nr:helix-turn-helix transcriptional regulator [Actinomycetaceae bacterium]MDY5273625.1 helix-turn-helix transcriptional regulator [Arcanobacterium sp.]